MTCIVGYVDEGTVYIGADSAGSNGSSIMTRADMKVFEKSGFLFGFTSSFRMGQILKYKFEIPFLVKGRDVDEYMHTEFIDEIIACFEKNGYLQTKDSVISGGSFLVGAFGSLWRVESDFQIAQSDRNYDAVGCGQDVALGCFYGLEYDHPEHSGYTAEEMVLRSLQASEQFSYGVRGPFHVLRIKTGMRLGGGD